MLLLDFTTAFWYLLLTDHFSSSVRIGAIFQSVEDYHLYAAFNYSVSWTRRNVLFREKLNLQPDIRLLYSNSTSELTFKLCDLMDRGVSAVFGPTNPVLSRHLEYLCDQLEIPYFKVQSQPHANSHHLMTVELFPDDDFLNALADLITYWEWTGLIVVYKDDRRLPRLGRLFSHPRMADVKLKIIKVENNDFRASARILRDLEDYCVDDPFKPTHSCSASPRIFLDLDTSDVYPFMVAALQFGLIDSRHWYLLASLDIEEIDMELFRYNRVRITGFDILNRSSELDYQNLLESVKRKWSLKKRSRNYFPMTDCVLMFDAVYAFAKGYLNMDPAHNYYRSRPERRARCGPRSHNDQQQLQTLPHGMTLYNYIRNVLIYGLSGKIMFSSGKRTNLSLNIYQLGYKGSISQIGSWESASAPRGVNITAETPKHINLTTTTERPYVMRMKDNRSFEGFCIDLLKRLAADLNFDYEISLVADGKYGSENDTDGTWNGMIGEILNGEADMAVAPLTVNFRRNQKVDFTKPFLSMGISILFRIPGPQKPELFSFLNPLSHDTWLYIGVSIIVVIFVLFLIGRVTPYEWNEERDRETMYASNSFNSPRLCPAPPPPPPAELHNNYTFMNTVWYVASTLLKGGCDFGPRAVSTRLLGGVWWVFTLILVSAYTANLAAVLTVDRRFIPIKSLEDLANQTHIAFGALDGGSTMQFFRESKNISTHAAIWRYMNRTANVLAATGKDGVRRVLEQNYAYLMESISLQFEKHQNCNLTQVGGVLGSRGYGIALQKRSHWTDEISRKILDYGEKGIIELIKTKWWKNKYGSCDVSTAQMKETRIPLNMQNVAGLFVMLVGGLCAAVVFVVVEFVVTSRRNAAVDQVPLCSELGQELRFAVRLQNTRKHILQKKCPQCDFDSVPMSMMELEGMASTHVPTVHHPCSVKLARGQNPNNGELKTETENIDLKSSDD